ncbi:MAG: hypothetical protein SFW67_24025 [Myxococcaceae bacterium]|nr:hypothetical protein [Myxococcaceae bacterium]
MRSLPLLFVLLVSACGSTVIDAKDYTQACAADSECVVVSDGDLCNPCNPACRPAAINRGDESRFTSDSATLRRSCPPRLGPVGCPAIACAQPEAFCNAGVCATRPAFR